MTIFGLLCTFLSSLFEVEEHDKRDRVLLTREAEKTTPFWIHLPSIQLGQGIAYGKM